MICAPDSTHRPCDCGADSPNCEVCDEQPWDAAWDAAWSLVARDLISAEHYTALTGPWRSALGPIHPDDDDWSGDA